MNVASANLYKQRLAEERKVFVYYIPMLLADGARKYFYVAASALLHDKFIEAIEVNQIPDFAVVVEKGDGEPTNEVKEKMRHYYNFEHNEAEDFLLAARSSIN